MRIAGLEFGGRDGSNISFVAAAGAVENDAVTLTAAGTTGRGAADAALLGQVIAVDSDGIATVRTKGEVLLTFTGTFNPGFALLAVDGTGKVKTHTAGRPAFIVGTNGTKAIVIL
jgi:hypothetical protein